MKLTIPFPQAPSSALYLHIFYLFLTFITACSVFKERSFLQADSLRRHDTRKELNQQTVKKSESLSFYSKTDSADRLTFAEIFPAGPFKYTPTDGFSGEAGRVVISERMKETKRLEMAEQLKETSELKSGLKESKGEIVQTRLKEKEVKTNNLNMWMLAAVALIFILIFLFRKYLK